MLPIINYLSKIFYKGEDSYRPEWPSLEEEVEYRMSKAFHEKFDHPTCASKSKNRYSTLLTSSEVLEDHVVDNPKQEENKLKMITKFQANIKDAEINPETVIDFGFHENWTKEEFPPCFSHSRPNGNKNIILWPHPLCQIINTKRFGPLTPGTDCAWEDKIEKLVWRGASNSLVKKHGKASRLELVEKYYNHPDCDIGFSRMTQKHELSDEELKKKGYIKEVLNFREQLRYKYLIYMEGNDFGSSEAWMHTSNSVVFTHPNTVESIANFGLKPWVHYVPIKEDLSDLPEKIDWCRKNDVEAKRIVTNSANFTLRLFNSKRELEIRKKIIQIYQSNLKI